jgi:hypothetical protein
VVNEKSLLGKMNNCVFKSNHLATVILQREEGYNAKEVF